MITVSHFSVPEQIDALNKFLGENAEKISTQDGIQFFNGYVMVILEEDTDEANVLGAAKANLRQSKLSLSNLDFTIAKLRLEASMGGKNEQSVMHKIGDAEDSRKRTLDDIVIQTQIIASIQDGSWLKEVTA